MRKSSYIVFLGIALIITSCIEPVDIDTSSNVEFLVVQGSITDELTNHWVKVSTSISLTDTLSPAEQAVVWVLDGSGVRYNYERLPDGSYASIDMFRGQPGQTYTLRIQKGLDIITSTPQVLMTSPSPDSIYARAITTVTEETDGETLGLQFLLDITNLGAEERSFRFDIVEDYETRVPFPSGYFWDPATLLMTRRDTALTACYRQEFPEEIILTTTFGQSENAVREFPLVFVPDDSEKLRHAHSVSVRQFTISQETFDYYRILNENNRSSGSFFDTQRGTVQGNLSVVGDETQTVLGYFEVAGVTESRIYMTNNDIRRFLLPRNTDRSFEIDCREEADTLFRDAVNLFFLDDLNRATFGIGVMVPDRNPFPDPDGLYIIAPRDCTDCRQNGATLNRPDFWD